MASTQVKVSGGTLQGSATADGVVRAFRGIPYAQPPVGPLRWRAPLPPKPWDGVRKTEKFAAVSVQAPRPTGSISDFGAEPHSEDCLYLNVWTGAASADEKRPVLFWIHGGGFTYGSGSLPLFNGEYLARKGVVVVTINYRLGPLGFLAHPELSAESEHGTSGNYGFLDQIAALRWVQENIAAFGGDPQRVTIFGQSVGSSSVSCLVASPLAKGLIHRAICQSGGSVGPLGSPGGGSMQTLKQAEEVGLGFARSLGAHSIADMRALPAEKINLLPPGLDAKAQAAGNRHLRNSGWVIVDGHAVPTSVHEIFGHGRQNDIPIITGANSHEGSAGPMATTLADYEAECRAIYGDRTDELFRLYKVREASQINEVARLINGHRTFNWQNWTTARLHSKTARSKAFTYHFKRLPPFPSGATYSDNTPANLGAFHTAEIPYVYANLGVRDWPWTPADRALAETMSSYWVNFATHGDPNGAGLPAWPAFDDTTQPVMIFDETASVGAIPRKDQLEFWDAHFADERKKTG